jgi:hypothetical protein
MYMLRLHQSQLRRKKYQQQKLMVGSNYIQHPRELSHLMGHPTLRTWRVPTSYYRFIQIRIEHTLLFLDNDNNVLTISR